MVLGWLRRNISTPLHDAAAGADELVSGGRNSNRVLKDNRFWADSIGWDMQEKQGKRLLEKQDMFAQQLGMKENAEYRQGLESMAAAMVETRLAQAAERIATLEATPGGLAEWQKKDLIENKALQARLEGWKAHPETLKETLASHGHSLADFFEKELGERGMTDDMRTELGRQLLKLNSAIHTRRLEAINGQVGTAAATAETVLIESAKIIANVAAPGLGGIAVNQAVGVADQAEALGRPTEGSERRGGALARWITGNSRNVTLGSVMEDISEAVSFKRLGWFGNQVLQTTVKKAGDTLDDRTLARRAAQNGASPRPDSPTTDTAPQAPLAAQPPAAPAPYSRTGEPQARPAARREEAREEESNLLGSLGDVLRNMLQSLAAMFQGNGAQQAQPQAAAAPEKPDPAVAKGLENLGRVTMQGIAALAENPDFLKAVGGMQGRVGYTITGTQTAAVGTLGSQNIGTEQSAQNKGAGV